MSVIRERRWGGAGRMSDKVDREPANRAGTTLKNRLVGSTLPGDATLRKHMLCFFVFL